MTDPADETAVTRLDPEVYQREVRRRQLGKARVTGLVLVALVVLIYAITFVRIGAH